MVSKTKGFADGIFPEEMKKALKSVAMEWGDVVEDMKALQVIPMKGAMTNEVYQINWPTKEGEISRKLLIRIYGEGVDVFFNRDVEVRTFECMSNHGQGPRLLGRFPQGRVEEFIHARTLSASDLRDPEISDLIAAKMREFHYLDMPGPRIVSLWNRMRDWLREARRLCSLKDAEEFSLDLLKKEIDMLEDFVSKGSQEIGFCHNDLQYGNIMMDEETRAITLIDYEYASFNPIAYDLANHFCEMAANYHTDTPHILDYDKYPGDEPTEDEVIKVAEEVEKYKPANHLFWGLWGIISRYVNQIDFDYLEYARQRLQQYWICKAKALGLICSCENGHADVLLGKRSLRSDTDSQHKLERNIKSLPRKSCLPP
ncbi:Probable choline kinase 1 [Linum perenne]